MGSLRLDGKVAFVTGASSGIGEHFARVLAGEGANVVLAARRIDRLERLSEELSSKNVKCLAVKMDVTDTNSCEQAFNMAEQELGTVNIVVNNAGVARPKNFIESTEEDWDITMDANLKGVWRVGKIAAERMVNAGCPGSIINITSIFALGVSVQQSAYATSKAAVAQLTKSMATELFQSGIRVNAICPGYFLTELNEDFFATDNGKKYISRIPPRRLGELAELSGPLLMLASDESTFVNGAIIPVDGGHSIRLA